MKEVVLPSGALLKIGIASFIEAKFVYQAILEELGTLPINDSTEVLGSEFIKNLACMFFSSKKIETALNACLKRCLYNDRKIDNDIFEDELNRGDYLIVIAEVMDETISPFVKNLLPALKILGERSGNILK